MYLYIDCETGGLPKNTSLLTLGMIVTDNEFNIKEEIEFKLKPNDRIYLVTAQALAINKIDLIKHDKEAVKYKDAKTPLHLFLHKWWGNNGVTPLIPVGKNLAFDCQRIFGNVISKAHWETMVSYQPFELNGAWRLLELQGKVPVLPKTSLSDLCNYFNIPVSHGQLHTANGDNHLYIEVCKKMKQL